MVHTFTCDKTLLKSLLRETPPSEEIRAKIRKDKPTCCIICESEVLHGNGWRSRALVKSWDEWAWLWYWRLKCQSCGKSHCLMPEIVIPDLLYEADMVVEVVSGRLSGRSTKEFPPDRRTQKRWLDRIREAWPVALSSGAIRGVLSEWTGSLSRLLEAVHRCASHHVGLFFPSRNERQQRGGNPRRSYPAIATHQTCSWTGIALM